ncbi:unnamed protein product [Oncorhynchus mykiss]|uniref:Sushi domain-containing protein n=1 Tax=Oncorhynchus mykiss TaxID=8022 RepID=A0A060XIR2_ONCMY|nr:unnamed protein product [Oncorhynchus mykiss]
MQSSLKQVQKLLSTHEAAYLQSLRTLRKKLNLLQNTATKQTGKVNNVLAYVPLPTAPHRFTYTCLKLDTPANSRKLGKAQNPGHEVHFLCDAGYELVGAEFRMCQESLTWSGQQPTCSNINECGSSPCLNGGTCVDEMNQFSCTCTKGWAGATCQSPVPTCRARHRGRPRSTPSRWFWLAGLSYTLRAPGRACASIRPSLVLFLSVCLSHFSPMCYRCTCPAGYNVTRDGRNCKGERRPHTLLNNCTRDQMCINNYGGFQCVRVDCSRIRNATYSKTSPLRCERNPCSVDNKVCSQAPNSISHHYLSVVSNLSAPRTMFRVSTLRLMGDTLRFSLLGRGQVRRHFAVQRSDRQTGQLVLGSPVQRPATLEAEVEMTELEKGVQLGRYITKITMFISQYEF